MTPTGTDVQLEHVTSGFNYLGEVQGTPTHYFEGDPPSGVPRLFPRVERRMPVFNARPIVNALSLEREGLMLVDNPEGELADFYDQDAIHRDYYPAVERLVTALAGAARVLVFDHTYRSSALREDADDGTQTAVEEVHNDYTEASGPARVREKIELLAPETDAAQLMQSRYAVFNIWRPINGSVEEMPLSICDAQSMAREDFVATELRWRRRTGYVSTVKHAESHRWLYFPQMRVDEALVFKAFDSAHDGRARYGAHSAFIDPNSPADARHRESIEARAIALF